MSDRGVFLTAFLTAVLIIAGAFVLPQFFYFELAKASIYIVISVLVYFGEDKFSYMLGIIAPPLWFIIDILGGIFFDDFRVLFDYLARKGVPALDTPLHAVARLMAILLFIASLRSWRKQVPERFLGKTFWICLVISLIYAGTLALIFVRILATTGRKPI